MTDDEAHRALGTAAGAGAKEVQAAYRRKALELHPDRAGSARQSEYFYRKFLEVRDAYEHLRKAGFPAAAQPIPEAEEVAPEMPRSWESWTATRWHHHHGKPLWDAPSQLEKLGFEFKFDTRAVALWAIFIPGAGYVLVRFVQFLLAAVRGPEGG